MSSFSQADVDQLIGCAKDISDPPAKDLKLDGAFWRNKAKMIATDGSPGTFSMFMRKSDDFSENFSIGLTFTAHDERGEITLLRCNGKHGTFNGNGDASHPHWDFHVHRASEKAMDEGSTSEKYAEKTTEFASYEEALSFFLSAVRLNSKDVIKYFPAQTQMNIFAAPDGDTDVY